MKRRFGFTLIELLIVIAIVAILAALAVTNFLEAQTRSKVSRAQSDMRSLLVGLAAYSVDNNRMLRNTPDSPILGQESFVYVTTPIAYLSSIPVDVFYRGNDTPSNDPPLSYYAYLDVVQLTELSILDVDEKWEEGFFIVSRGPDGDFDANDIIEGELLHDRTIYSPFNGTVSEGDIFLSFQGFSVDQHDRNQEDAD